MSIQCAQIQQPREAVPSYLVTKMRRDEDVSRVGGALWLWRRKREFGWIPR